MKGIFGSGEEDETNNKQQQQNHYALRDVAFGLNCFDLSLGAARWWRVSQEDSFRERERERQRVA